ARFDDVLVDTDGTPFSDAIARLDQDTGSRRRAGRRIENTDLVIREMDVFELTVVAHQRSPQCGVERVDRAVAFRDAVLGFGPDAYLDHRLAHRCVAFAPDGHV